jgi:hypothetical protein
MRWSNLKKLVLLMEPQHFAGAGAEIFVLGSGSRLKSYKILPNQ